jgi:hypothetical protein
MKEKLNKIIIRIPKNVIKSFRVLTYMFLAAIVSFAADYTLTGEINWEELEAVVRTYGFNILMVVAVLLKSKGE